MRPFLWSYDFNRLDLKKDKKVIIKNILDYGNKLSIDWLKQVYSPEEIKEVIRQTYTSEWSKKSINFWSLIYNVQPKRKSRF
ncbi:MAG TPA: hypothetical protein ENL05_01760 [Candidatus Moranbacteria bacterium]|nr:hypothetical protein [Candidatus Moranbacteria bacterium]